MKIVSLKPSPTHGQGSGSIGNGSGKTRSWSLFRRPPAWTPKNIRRKMGFKLSLKASSLLVCFIDIVSAAALTILCILAWQAMDRSAIFWYQPKPKTSNQEINENLYACVTFWTLSLILVMAYVRLVLVSLLFTVIKKKSTQMAYGWMALKAFGVIMSIFLVLSSMTVGFYTRAAAVADFGFHIITVYYIKVLYDSLGELERSADLITKSEIAE